MEPSLEINIEGFSGPFDLLCHLVESRQMQASKIKVGNLVRIYGAYLAHTRKASIEVIANFFFMAANLLLNKVTSLLPDQEETSGDFFEETEDPVVSEEELLERLARYLPYRNATAWLMTKKEGMDKRFRRIMEEEDLEPIYDLGDLYSLCVIWWNLIEKLRILREEAREDSFDAEEEIWNGVPESLPDEAQIQNRIMEITEKLALDSSLSLQELLMSVPSVKILVVTLLAVLEMCRMGTAKVSQETVFGDVKICAA
jgi:segregation and condensation protein A